MSFTKILVAIDYSELTRAVFTQALDLAVSQGASLFLFHCLANDTLGEPLPVSMELGLYPNLVESAYQEGQSRVEEQIQQVQSLLQSYQDHAAQQGVAATVDYKLGNPGQLLCEVAQDWSADLIVVGRRGRSGLSEALLGSVSNYVLHHAPCAVLIIQPETTTPA